VEFSNVPVELSTGVPLFSMNFMRKSISDLRCKGLHSVSCAITVVTYAYIEGNVNSRRCLLGSRLWTGLTATVEKKL
jgi:hypothetical protein